MTSCDDFIDELRKELPKLCTAKDLVKFGLYKSEQAAYNARKKGHAFDHFKMPHGTIVYPREGVIESLEKSKYSPNESYFHENYNTGRPYTQGTSSDNKKGIRL